MKKIVITGSSGFIGYYLSKKLLDSGFNVIGVDNHSDNYDLDLKKHRQKILEKYVNFRFLNLDINNLDMLDGCYDLAINLAAQPGVRISPEKEHLYEHSNVNGFKEFCNFFVKQKVKRIIYASSSAVYADSNLAKFNESKSELKPKSLYGMSKLANEEHALKIAKSTDTKIIGFRFFSVYGPLGRPDMAYYSFTNSIKKGETIYLNNDGLMYRDMTYIDDIVDGIYSAIKLISKESYKSNHEIFNLGNDAPIQTIKVLSTIELKLRKKTKIQHMNSNNESYRTHADITKAKNLLGYDPKVKFDEGIERFLDWHNHYENL